MNPGFFFFADRYPDPELKTGPADVVGRLHTIDKANAPGDSFRKRKSAR